MIATPASVERVQKCAFNFEIYRFLKKATNLPHLPLFFKLGAPFSEILVDKIRHLFRFNVMPSLIHHHPERSEESIQTDGRTDRDRSTLRCRGHRDRGHRS